MKKMYDIVVKEFYSASLGLKKIEDFYIYKYENDFGVGIENKNKIKIDEMFANVKLRSIVIPIEDNNVFELIVLTSSLNSHKNEFASFCVEFLNPKNREEIKKDPLKWWKKWRELIGNKFSEVKVYDVIAELLTLEKLSNKNKNLTWKGPTGSSIDIESSECFYEVKSSRIRYENEITVSSQFQLVEYDKPTFLIFYKMEEMINGETINKIMERMDKSGIINIEEIEDKLIRLGFRQNVSIRDKSYVIHEVRKYDMREGFPKITLNSFVDQKLPDNIKKISYTISLDGIDYTNWER